MDDGIGRLVGVWVAAGEGEIKGFNTGGAEDGTEGTDGALGEVFTFNSNSVSFSLVFF
jgi:hypothetical protein